MAAKRISQSSINWVKLLERVPEPQKPQFLAFKSKSDGYLRRVLANPATPPKLDWSLYKQKVPIAGMVDEFQKQYEALSIPFPPDTATVKVEEQTKEVRAEIAAFKKESMGRIEELKKQQAHLSSLLPFDQMTMEDFRDSYPDLALDPINKPTFWPHEPEEQIGYKGDKDEPSQH